MQTKLCSTCGAEKPATDFQRDVRSRDGLCRYCRPCRSIRKKAEYQRSREKILANLKPKTPAEKLLKREYDRAYRARRAAHLDALKVVWRANNAAKVLSIKAAYKKRNPHRDAEHAMRRNARKRRASPWWLTDDDYERMRSIYLDAATRPGGPWHVDHIVPLGGKTVCGLHVPWNLRVILQSENQRKSATLDQDLAAA